MELVKNQSVEFMNIVPTIQEKLTDKKSNTAESALIQMKHLLETYSKSLFPNIEDILTKLIDRLADWQIQNLLQCKHYGQKELQNLRNILPQGPAINMLRQKLKNVSNAQIQSLQQDKKMETEEFLDVQILLIQFRDIRLQCINQKSKQKDLN